MRSWTGWYRHITLAMLEHAYRTVVRTTIVGRIGGDRFTIDLLPHTVPEVRRPLGRLVWVRPPDPAQVLAWSTWR